MTELLLITLASLTGAFSAFLIPLVLLRAALLRDARMRWPMYAILPVCGSIQAVLILASGRVTQAPIDLSMERWLRIASSFIFFGNAGLLARVRGRNL